MKMKLNFENFQMFLSNINFSFGIICFYEIWLNDSNVDKSIIAELCPCTPSKKSL